MQKTTYKVEEFIKGKYPQCKGSSNGYHVKLSGMGFKPQCLWCGKSLPKSYRSPLELRTSY